MGDDRGLPLPHPVETMQYVVDVLNEARAACAPEGREAGTVLRPESTHDPLPEGPCAPHVFLSGWGTDYLRASDFIESNFRCGASANASGLCDARLDARIEEAKQLQLTDPAAGECRVDRTSSTALSTTRCGPHSRTPLPRMRSRHVSGTSRFTPSGASC